MSIDQQGHTYKQLMDEIARMTDLAEEVRRSEIQAVVAEMKEKINLYELKAEDLGFAPVQIIDATPKPKARAVKSTSDKPVRYRSESGQTWSGMGRTPNWIIALEAAGGDRKDVLVKP